MAKKENDPEGDDYTKSKQSRHLRIHLDWAVRTILFIVIDFLTSSEFYVPTFTFKSSFPNFPVPERRHLVHEAAREAPDDDVTVSGGYITEDDVGGDSNDGDDNAETDDAVVWPTIKLASGTRHEDESYVTSQIEVLTSTEGERDGMTAQREVSTLTDVCYNENLAEVDLVSLIEEQIPRYILRADTLTDFAGYDNNDWIQTPCLPPGIDLNLSPIVIEETLKYFILCAERVSQMTKTYNDIEAVTRLLEEKERDLELAARIGQNLLDKNKELEEKNELLEEQLSHTTESVSQLRHDISMKDALLQAYLHDYESPETPGDSPGGKAFLGLGHVDNLQKKVRGLEEENLTLRCETAQLKVETCDLEEKEEKLVKDAVRQLADVNGQIHALQDELFAKTEVNIKQQEEITTLMSKIISLESDVKKVSIENLELKHHLTAAQESQKELTTELSEQRDKYNELLALLQEVQEEAKALRSKAGPNAVRQHYGLYTPFLPEGSLAMELEDSIKKDMVYPDGYSPSERRCHNKRVMETAKIAKRHGHRKSTSLLSIPGSNHSTSGNETCESIAGSSNRSSIYLSESESFHEGYSADVDSNYGSASTTLGRPGIPGSNDLETALKRLTLRKANEINESILKEVDEKGKSGGSSTPTGYQTPDSLMSTGSGSNFSDLSRFSGYSGYGFRIPEKLQIVKPMEGSMTLHQWQRLATPHLGGFLDPRPGIQNKGEKPLEMDQEVYTLSDYEEDGEADFNYPGKADALCQSTYTYTTSKIMHPTDQYDNLHLTSVYGGPPRPIISSSEAPPSRNAANCTTTFSMNLGLATLLKERGIKSASPRQPAPKETVSTGAKSKTKSSSSSKIHHTPVRFGSIVTETMSGGTQSQTELIYTNNGASPAGDGTITISTNIPPFEGISDTAMPLIHPDTYEIVDQVLNNQLEKTASTTAAAVNILGAGLNTILPVNNRKGLATRRDAMNGSVTKSPLNQLSPNRAKQAMRKYSPSKFSPTKVASHPNNIDLGSSASSGVLTRAGAAKLKQDLSMSPKDSPQTDNALFTTNSRRGAPAKENITRPNSLKISSFSSPATSMLTTSTYSSNYYSSPISHAALPSMGGDDNRKTEDKNCDDRKPACDKAITSSNTGSPKDSSLSSGLATGATTLGNVPMSESLIKHLAKIRMKRRQAGLIGHLNSGLSNIVSPKDNTAESPHKSADID